MSGARSNTLRFLGTLVFALVSVFQCTGLGCAQDIYPGFVDGYSPLLSLGKLQGETKTALVWMGIADGRNSVPSQGVSYGLRDNFNMRRGFFFVDSALRFQLGRFSLRGHHEVREFKGSTNFRNQPGQIMADARLEFSGLRVGMDFDLISRYRSRMGLNFDYNLSRPIFTESIMTDAGGKKMIGEAPITMGIHALIAPMRSFYGLSGLFEGRVRWTVQTLSNTPMRDMELSAGLRSAESLLGSMAIKGGYRATSLGFTDTQILNGLPGATNLSVDFSGWFAELVYYY